MDVKFGRRECAELAERAWEPVGGLLTSGNCEPFKAGVHGVVLALVALCASYNTAALLKRREGRHLAINAVVYGMAVWWESRHVMHHLAACPAPVAATPLVPAVTSEAA